MVLNVLFGRYKMVFMEIQDYVYGFYGRPPVFILGEVRKLVMKGSKKGKELITCRPVDLI